MDLPASVSTRGKVFCWVAEEYPLLLPVLYYYHNLTINIEMQNKHKHKATNTQSTSPEGEGEAGAVDIQLELTFSLQQIGTTIPSSAS